MLKISSRLLASSIALGVAWGVLAPREARAQGVTPVLTSVRITDATVALIDPETGTSTGSGSGNDTRLAPGDVISFRMRYFPVPNKILRGLQGYLTEYVPPNTSVVGVRFIDANGNTIEPNLPGMANDVAGGAGLGSIAQQIADTGVFYSNSTAFDRNPSNAFITLTNGLQITPANGSGTNGPGDLVGAGTSGPYFAHNAWDDAIVDTPVAAFGNNAFGDATGPLLFERGSPVASTTSFNQFDQTGAAGPFTRILYPGSLGWPSAVARPAPSGIEWVRVGVPMDTTGTDLVPLTPTAARVVRYAGGQLVTGVPVDVEVFLRVNAVPLDPGMPAGQRDINCAEAFGGDTSGRNPAFGNTSVSSNTGAKLPTWPFFVPSPGCVYLNLLFNLDVDETLAVGNNLTYTIRSSNLSQLVTHTGGTVTLRLDAALTPTVGGISDGGTFGPCSPAVAGYNCVTWSLAGQFATGYAPGNDFTRTVSVNVAGSPGKDSITTFATFTSAQLPGGFTTQAQSMVSGIFVQSHTLTTAANPPTTGGNALVTGNVTNTGTTEGSVENYLLYLPTGWTLLNDQVSFTSNAGTTVETCVLHNGGSGPRVITLPGYPTPPSPIRRWECAIAPQRQNLLPGAQMGISFTAVVPNGTAAGNYTIDAGIVIQQQGWGGRSESHFRKVVTVPVGKPRNAAPVISCNLLPSVPVTTTSAAITGTGPANETINVYFNGILRGTTTTNGSGAWSFPVPGSFGPLYPGLEVTATAGAINASDDGLESVKSAACFVSGAAGCSDGKDNDLDGKCDFGGCYINGVYTPPDPGCYAPNDNDEADNQCTDGVDNAPTNGLIDYPNDPTCYGPSDPLEGNTACNDGVDNDGDGNCDFGGCTVNGTPLPADPDCQNANDLVEWPAPACGDGIDNDSPPDGLIDYPADPGCHSINDDSESVATAADTKPRMLLVFDTSGSMHFNSCNDTFTGGDGSTECPGSDVQAAVCDSNTDGNGLPDDSRLFKAKEGVANVVSAFGEVNYGLMRFHQTPIEFSCPSSRGSFPSGGWQGGSAAAPLPQGQTPNCGALPGLGYNAGDVLVRFSLENPYDIVEWVDHDANWSGAGTPPPGRDYELRGSGTTPLAGSLTSALSYLQGVRATDSILQCRPYGVILLTDGVESCGGNPAAAAAAIYNQMPPAQPNIPVYVIGFAVSNPQQQASLNAIAASGGTGTAIFVDDSAALSAAIANIVQDSVKVEICNGADDNCNGLIDEGTGAYRECAAGSPNCNAGRLTCTQDSDCGPGFACALGTPRFCLPSCSVGSSTCARTGVIKACQTACCVNDGQGACTPLTAATQPETCNGVDDDCDGIIDECVGPSDPGGTIPGSCCRCPECAEQKGATPANPLPETCDGCDEDCNGVADDNLTDIGLNCGVDVGQCTQGTSFCCQEASPGVGNCTRDSQTESDGSDGLPVHVNMNTLRCLGGSGPGTEACNGVDDDCNGQTDEVTSSCFPPNPSGVGAPTPGVGICIAGTAACNATPGAPDTCGGAAPPGKPCPGPASYSGTCNGFTGPIAELCNNVDDDCDGQTDEGVTGGQFGMPCCPPGRDCTLGNGCTPGTWQCQNGQQVCVGAVFRTPEVCDGVDNDCNGITDTDTTGYNNPCTGSGIFTLGVCKAQLRCELPSGHVPGTLGNPNGPRGLTCVQTTGPSNELCNSLDDNCNGQIDENLMDPALNQRCDDTLTAQEMAMFPGASIDTLPCMPGNTVCDNGVVVCVGRKGPQKNLCDGISRDCTGVPNVNGDCEPGLVCTTSGCVSPCSGGEFPCPGGFVCQGGLCIPDGCANKTCATGERCEVDANGMGVCVDPCLTVTCPAGFRCNLGACVDDTCVTFGCPGDNLCVGTACPEKCVGNPAMCEQNPCWDSSINGPKMCPEGQTCNNAGDCVVDCTQMCMKGDVCINGECVPDPCKGVVCQTGQVCSIQNGVGVCIENQCLQGCRDNQACCNGMCVTDQCRGLLCPEGSQCVLDATCNAVCSTGNEGGNEQIVGAGGGGFACSYGGTTPSPAPAAPIVLALMTLAFIRPRRRNQQ